MSFQTIAVRAGEIAEIRLNRPGDGNPVDRALLDELKTACATLHDDASVRVVLLTAEGAVFSSSDAYPAAGEAGRRLPFRFLETMAQPVVAVIDGDAMGAGLELALACDLRMASDGASFALSPAMPSLGGTQRLPRLVGRARAAAMILLGERISASEALAYGLVNAVAPAGEARPAAERIAGAIASRGPLAVRYAKEALLRGLDLPLEQALRFETDLTVILQTTRDREEGVRAFLEKRPPRFEGR